MTLSPQRERIIAFGAAGTGSPYAGNFDWRKLPKATSSIADLKVGCARNVSTDDVVGAPFPQASVLEA